MANTTSNTQFTVTGIVRAAESQKILSGMRIQVCDCDLRRQQPLHDNALITDREGRYSVAFTKGRFLRTEKDGPDVQVLVFAPEDEALEQVLFRSSIRFNAPEHSEIDLTVPADAYREPVEWTQLQVEAKRLGQRSGLSVEEWEENEAHRDLSFIAGETGRDVKVLRAFALAYRLAKGTKIPREAWFALLRYETIGTNLFESVDLADQTTQILQALPNLDVDMARRSLQRAIQNRNIPEMEERAIEACIVEWQALSIAQMDQQANRARQVAELAGLSAGKRKQYLAFFKQNNLRLGEGLSAILRESQTFTAKEIAALEASARLAELTGDHFELIRLLQANGGRKMLNPPHLAQHPVEFWDDLLEKIPQAASDSRSDALTEAPISGSVLAARFKSAYPTQAFMGALSRSQTAQQRSIASNAAVPLRHADRIEQFLKENPDFDFLDTKIQLETWLNKAKNGQRSVAAADSESETGFLDEIKAVQRVFRLNPDFDASMTLLGDGLHSGQQIYLLGEQQFTEQYAERPGFSEALARDTWRKSAELNHSIVYWLGEVRANQNAQLIKALRNGDPNPNLPEARGTFPNYETLFGSTDICTCEHCKSVYSPAAYLVDTIMFLQNRKINDPNYPNYKSAWDVLRERRPDIGFLDFSCDNSNVVLPYIDLVNEVLEESVGGMQGISINFTLPTLPEKATNDDLLAFQKEVYKRIQRELEISSKKIILSDNGAINNLQTPSRGWVVRDKKYTLSVLESSSPNKFYVKELPQTRGKSESLIARPQFTNTVAYNKLARSSYPHNLPLDLPLEELTHYLNKVGINRWELMQTVKALYTNELSNEDIACAYFNISVQNTDFQEKSIILKMANTPNTQASFWGLTASQVILPITETKLSVNDFLNKTGLDYSQLLVLLDLEFINPNGALVLGFTTDSIPEECNTKKQFIENLDIDALDRIHRFLRLLRKTNLTFWELDMLIMHKAFGNGYLGNQEKMQDQWQVSEGFLTRLMFGLEIKKRLGLTIEQLCSLFGQIPTRSQYVAVGKPRQPSFYHQMFLNPLRLNPIDTNLEALINKANIKISTSRLGLLAGLRIKSSELDVLLKKLEINPDGYIALDKLAELNFHVILSNALSISITDWVVLYPLVDITPFANGAQHEVPLSPTTPKINTAFLNPRTALIWLERFNMLMKMGFSTEELLFLMSQNSPKDSNPFSLPKNKKWFDELGKALRVIKEEYRTDKLPVIPVFQDELLTEEEIKIQKDSSSQLTHLLQKSLSEWLNWNDSEINNLLNLLEDPQMIKAGYSGLIVEKQNRLRNALMVYQIPNLAIPVDMLPRNFTKNAYINYDPITNRLLQRGILSAEEFEELRLQSNEEWWVKAINNLSEAQSVYLDNPMNKWKDESSFTDFTKDLVANLKLLLDDLYVWKWMSESRALILKTLVEQLPINDKTKAWALINEIPLILLEANIKAPFMKLVSNQINAEDDAILVFQVLCRAVIIAEKWGIGLEDWKLLLTKLNSPVGGFVSPMWFVLSSPSPNSVLHSDRLFNLYRMWEFQKRYASEDYTFFRLLAKLNNSGQHFEQFSDFATVVHSMTGWDTFLVNITRGQLNTTDYFMKMDTWELLERLIGISKKANADYVTLFNISQPKVTDTIANRAITRLASQYEEKQQNELHRDVQNILREKKRNALISWLLNNKNQWLDNSKHGEIIDANHLLGHFLIDVEMSSCHLTSRIVQAHGTVQMFVQRCLLGLEPAVRPREDAATWEQWKWMKNYRIWEANRKVFLYPENWLEPELRRGKSPFFRDLENALLQSDLNRNAVESAFLHYVEQLDNLANLEPMGHWYEEEKDILHVFGRTSGEPHLYYYRQWKDNAYWTPWEKVDAEIKGDYLIPIMRNGQLFLFWPEFLEEPEVVTTVRVPIQDELKGNGGHFTVDQPLKKVKIFMVSSRFVDGKWTAKNMSKTCVELRNLPSTDVTSNLIFTPFFDIALSDTGKPISSNAFGFLCIKLSQQEIRYEGMFINSGNGRNIDAFDSSFENLDLAVFASFAVKNDVFYGTLYHNMRLIEKGGERISGDALTFNKGGVIYSEPKIHETILGQTPGYFSITDSWQPSIFYRTQWNYNNIRYKIPSFEFPAAIYDIISGGKIYTEEQYRLLNSGLALVLLEFFSNGKNLPFFFGDQKRKYFVLPVLESSNEQFYYRDYYLNLIDPDQVKKIRLDAAYNNVKYHFRAFYHPLTHFFRQKINSRGINELLKRDTQLEQKDFSFDSIYNPYPTNIYTPDTSEIPQNLRTYPVENVDFTTEGAYASYNWELFFHAPMLIAQRLTKNQQFEEAMQWYHYIFNPLGVEPPTSKQNLPWEEQQRFWITKPFFLRQKASRLVPDSYNGQNIQNWLRRLSELLTNAVALKDYKNIVEIWRKNPFDPHLIAQFRTLAYQKGVVMKYIDNLIAWGDQLFRRDTMETVNEATQLYVLAAEILGPRPRKTPARYETYPLSFYELEQKFDAFSNALIGLENTISVLPTGSQAPPNGNLNSMSMLFFCLPPNEKLLEYWDTVSDRLYKIRHCQNIEGVERQLALFAPEIDPGLVINALTGDGSLDSALAEVNMPLSLYRFQVMLQKANEICNDLKALGGALLSALEKKDGEEMSRLRQGQEMDTLEAVRYLKQLQVNEAWKNVESLTNNRLTIQERVNHYVAINKIYPEETLSLDKMVKSQQYQELGQSQQVLAAKLAILPDFEFGISGFGGSPTANIKFGSSNFVQAVKASGEGYSFFSSILNNDSIQAAKSGENKRRSEEWKFQESLAIRELAQIDKQIDAARIRLQIAEKELSNHNLQITNARAIDEYMRSKYTNQELYEWMSTQISQVYFQTYQMAFDMAKQAERCLQYELGLENTRIIQYGHWDSLKKGLMSAERLQLDLRKLEMAYLERNKRELELSKHISLNQLNPLALLLLREKGTCDFSIPEELFDLDFPGHYLRRIKSVSITIPCVAGPYTSINATLRLKKNSTRVKAILKNDKYEKEKQEEDDRFRDQLTGIQSIATSSAQNDSGMFELNFRDERYLPFEGAGAISEWTLEMMEDKNLRQFDYNTISDVIVHLRYTAREGVNKAKVTSTLKAQLNALKISTEQTGLARLFSLRHDFPSEWHTWAKQNQPLSIKLEKHHFPYFAQMGSLRISKVEAYEKGKTTDQTTLTFDGNVNAGWTVSGTLNKAQEDYFLLIHYSI